jgi:hypothetical protein
MKHNTELQSKFIKDFFVENKDILYVCVIEKKYKLGYSLTNLIFGRQKMLSYKSIEKIRPFFEKFNILIPEEESVIDSIICNEISSLFEYKVISNSLKDSGRKRGYVYARNVCMLYNKRILGKTLEGSASPYGKNHSTLLHAEKTTDNLYRLDRSFRKVIDTIEQKLGIKGLVQC